MAAARSARFRPRLLRRAKAAHEALVELVAEGKDELMEEYFAEGTIPEQHLITALHEAIREDRIFPVLFASGASNVATDHLLDFIKVYAPAPIERAPMAVQAPALQAVAANGAAIGLLEAGHLRSAKSMTREPTAVCCVQDHDRSVCRTHHLLQSRQRRGQERCDARELHAPRGQERFSHLSMMQGRKAVEVQRAACGRSGRGGQAARDVHRRHAGREGRRDPDRLAACRSRP